MAKPMKTLELHYPMIQCLIIYILLRASADNINVISVMSRQSRVMSAVCLSYTVYRSVRSKHSCEFCPDYNRDYY